MAACIRAPRGQSTSIENIHHAKSSNNASSSHKSIVQIYLDWGNHYLEKARSKRLLSDLQSDLIDGVLLADLIEAVTSQKVPDIQRKPKTAGQMVENIRACLTTVERLGVNLEGVSVKEIRDGSLRSVLALFFALSKHKQQLKQQAESNRAKKHDAEMLSRLPTPYQTPIGHGHHQTSIPTPLSLRHNQTVHPVGSSPLKCPSTSSSRSTSPSHSFLPTPRGPARSSLNDKQLTQNSQRIASGRSAPSPASALSSPYSVPNKNNSMLDKFKLFNSKDKTKPVSNSAKRTSSSSGFSSARSERSDSSTSLYSENKTSNQAPERKEISQTDLNKVGGTVNAASKKQRTTVRVNGSGGDSRIVRPNSRTTSIASSTATNSRPNSGQSIGSSNSTAAAAPPPPPVETKPSPTNQSAVKTSSANRAESSRSQELTQPVNPPPPPAPTKATDSRPTMNEPVRMAGIGAGGATSTTPSSKMALSGGIPKPTAVVKGFSKPTHPVAPMPPPPALADHHQNEKEKQPQMTKNHRLDAVLESSHERQNSIEEAEEALANLKPMPPLLPGYNKRAMAIAPRTIPFNRSRGYRPLDTYPRSNTERNFADCDYSGSSVASGYLSDGEILHSKINEESNDGYLSEGGTALYQYAQHLRHKGGSGTLPRSDQSKSERSKQRHQAELREASRALHEARVELSNSDSHGAKVRVLNGTGTGGVVRDGGTSLSSSSAQPHPVVYRVIGSRHIKKSDSSQQTENSAFRQVSSSQWKGGNEVHQPRQHHDNRTELDSSASKNGREKRNQSSSNGVHRKQDRKHNGSREELDLDFCNGEKSSKGSSSGSSCGSGSKNKVRGSGPNFGYVNKKATSNGSVKDPRAVQVQSMPRTKVKVSGGTQTEYSGPQLSAGVRERLMMSSPKAASRHMESGSLSDSNYAEISTSPYSAWLRHSGAYTASLPARTSAAGVMIDPADSIESLPAQLHHHRASLTHARYIGSPATAPRLSRSNSIRSTKSEKLYPSMFQRSEDVEPYYSIPYNIGVSGGHHHHASQPTSPTPSQLSHGASARLNYPISPISSSPSTQGMNRNSPYMGIMAKVGSKDDEVHGSAVSLVSTTSSLYSTPEEKQAHEVRKLRKELGEAQEKVHSLTNQLSTNAHVVSAFEQSLSNMTQRLQQLTTTAEKKDSELMELRQTIELLRKQSVEAGLTSHNLSPSLSRRHTINSTPDNEGNISRQLSTDSVSSLNSLSSACSLSSPPINQENEKKKKRGWLRSSFNKAFSRTKKNRNGSGSSDVEDKVDGSASSSPLLNQPHQMNGDGSGGGSFRDDRGSHSPIDDYKESGPEVVEELKKQLREKDLVLTDIRLEALSSAHQLESLKDTVIKMRNEMVNLKQDNERLQRLVTSKSLTSSQSSLPRNDSLERRFSMNDAIQDCKYDLFAGDPDGKRVTLTVFMGCHGSYHRYVEDNAECAVAWLSISGKTKWEMLDAMIRRAFKDYLERIDPVGALGLAADSIYSYHIGEVVRYKDSKLPELLPCGYLVGDVSNVSVCLKGALHSGSLDALAFDTLVPKSIIQRYVSLLTEYRRIILCGPSGTGKTHLANKLAEFLVIRAGKESTAEAIATFNVEHKSSKELRQYLSNIAEQCETNAADLPSVIILDNLHQASSLTEVFNGFLKAKFHKCPFIIGTMNQATCSTTNLQLHHNFRWILCANHMEPVKGFLGRYLKRKFIETEARSGVRNPEMTRVTDWVPRAWLHLNQFLEAHSSSDVTIGPRLFLPCPMDSDGSQVWFTDLWNYSIVPYLLEAVREGLQMYGKRAAWQDPAQYVIHTYPWAGEAVHGGPEALIRLRPEDVGYDTHQPPTVQQPVKPQQQQQQQSTESEPADPLLNMLMRLQEAANYSNNAPTKDEIDAETIVDPATVQPVL